MRVEVGEGVGLLAKEEGLPLRAGINMSVVAGIAARSRVIVLTPRILPSFWVSKRVFQDLTPPMPISRVKYHHTDKTKSTTPDMHEQAHRISHIGLVKSLVSSRESHADTLEPSVNLAAE